MYPLLEQYPMLMPIAFVGVLALGIVGIVVFLVYGVKNKRAVNDLKKFIGFK